MLIIPSDIVGYNFFNLGPSVWFFLSIDNNFGKRKHGSGGLPFSRLGVLQSRCCRSFDAMYRWFVVHL